MVFTSPVFLSVFLPILFAVYALSQHRFRIRILLIASLFFYSWGEPKAVLIMILIIISTWLIGSKINKTDDTKLKKRYLILGVCINLSALIAYKYLTFILSNFNLLHLFNIKVPQILLPLGISFYIFQSLSYLVDVYRNKIQSSKSLINFAAYISLFPQLVAGPIVRYEAIEKSFDDRAFKTDNVFEGLQRFIMGFAKKVLIADTMAVIVDTIFAAEVSTIPLSITWLGAFCYALQIYFDFSGYSDMAIGLGRIFNFKFPENFNYPYSSKSITEFWRRWHMSLTSFFRDYLYIPLGGNRKGKVRTYLNLFIVFVLCGLWHGASWTFVIWGIYNGIGLIVERLGFLKVLEKIPAFFTNIYVWIFVMVGWVIFRAPSISYAIDYIKIMFGGNAQYPLSSFYQALNFGFISISNGYVLVIAAIISYPVMSNFLNKNKDKIWQMAALLFLFFLTFSFSMTVSYSPFLYFRF
ncbi:MAG: MBOAT family protein [Elusimicrobiota bacterium]|jgi:alginate O-acetyltransferase complex protein AlgI|nr:MBOAT family protein [Elusimicrobiota bacterium]